MLCETEFRTLLFITAYAFCFIKVSCNNESSIETYLSSAGKMTANNIRNSSAAFDKEHSTSEASVWSEGESTLPISREKINASSPKFIQNNSRNVFESDSINYSISSMDHKPHKGRKGAPTKEIQTEFTTLDTLKSLEIEKQPIMLANVTTIPTFPVASSIVNATTNASSVVSINDNKNSTQEHGNPAGVYANSTSPDLNTGKVKNSTTVNYLNFSEVLPSPKAKPKPEFTRDDGDGNDNSFSLSSAERNYVIPIVATIFAAPLLIVLAMFLYKRSKEFWERRHYRRMDFLIDGMYND